MFQEEKRSSTGIIITIVVLLLIAAGAGFWFYRQNRKPTLDAEITQVVAAPLHVTYGHVYGNAGPDQTDDATYIVAKIKINDRSSVAPLFLKDMTAHVKPSGYELLQATALEKDDLDKVLAGIPQVKKAADKIGGQPLLRETKIEPNSSTEGYAVFQLKCPEKIWNEREAAKVDIDFYHNLSTTASIAK